MNWSILKRFCDGKKVPIISSLLINNKLNQTSKLKQTVPADSLLQNVLHLLAAVMYLIHYNKFQPPGFTHFIQ